MCKHKSGGMSKPSGDANQHSALTQRTASFPSHNCPSGASSTLPSTADTNSIQTQLEMKPDLLFESQVNNSTSSAMAASASESGPSNTMAVGSIAEESLSSVYQPYSNAKKDLEKYSFLPHTTEEPAISQYSDSQDSDEEVATEQSPMLIAHNFSTYCTPLNSWNPSILSSTDLKEDKMSKCNCFFVANDSPLSRVDEIIHEESPIVSSSKQPNFRSCNPLISYQVPTSFIPPCGSGGCTGILDSAIKKNDDIEYSVLDQPNSSTKLGRRWLFPRHKCKSLDSDENSVGVHISAVCQRSSSLECSFNGSKFSGIAEESSLASSSNSCITATYSSSTINTDPVAGPSGLQRPNSIHWEIGTKDNKEDEFRCRSYSLTPTINFAVFESESSSETEDAPESHLHTAVTLNENQTVVAKRDDEAFHVPLSSIGKVIPISPSAAQLSLASSYGESGAPICKICHMTAKENDPLISPCRCSGTMQYIHCGCLMRWLEISSKRSRKPASCELCQYQYHWHKKFKVRHWQFPRCSRRDKILHFLFIISMLVMIACATITIMCFKQDKGTKVDPDRTELTQSEVVTLVCGVLFFLAFFVAMYVEVKSRNTIYKLLVKFIYLNQQWYIDEYEKKDTAPVAV